MTTRQKVVNTEPILVTYQEKIIDEEVVELEYDLIRNYDFNPFEYARKYCEENKDEIIQNAQLYGSFITTTRKDGDKIYISRSKVLRKEINPNERNNTRNE